MSDKTLTRADLVEAVVENVGLPRHEAAELVETVLQELSSTLARGEPVKLSSFGSFGIREKRQRIGRNPKTGEEVPITPRRVLVFRASNIMKKRIDETIKTDILKANGKSRPRSGQKTVTKTKMAGRAESKARSASSRSRSAGKSKAVSKPKAGAKATTNSTTKPKATKKTSTKKKATRKKSSKSVGK